MYNRDYDLKVLQREYDQLVRSLSLRLYNTLSNFYRLGGDSNEKDYIVSLLCISDANNRVQHARAYRAQSRYKRYKTVRANLRIDPISLRSMEYATRILPSYGKALEQFLETGVYSIDGVSYTFDDLKSCPYSDVLILAMGLDVYASAYSNELVKAETFDQLQWLFIRDYRQLTLYFYKMELELADEVLLKKQYDFIEHDMKCDSTFHNNTFLCRNKVKSIISEFFEPLTDGESYPSFSVFAGEIVGDYVKLHDRHLKKAMHSNGALSDIKGNCRQYFRRKFSSPECLTYYNSMFQFAYRFAIGQVVPSELAFVPKDGRAPRMIAMEPSYMGLAQSYFQLMFYERLKDFGIDLYNQDNNRFLALKSSGDKSYATIDMKNASDSIMQEHILQLFPGQWAKTLIDLTSRTVKLMDGYHYPLKCFATMGNKLTFPIQTILFYAISKAICDQYRIDGEVLVYGDDIIVRSSAYNVVKRALESYGFTVNESKSFRDSYFRESCGIFAWRGRDVSCIYRRKYNLTVDHVNELMSQHLYIENTFPKMIGIEGCVNCAPTYDEITNIPIRWNNILQRVEAKIKVHRVTGSLPEVDSETIEDDAAFYDEWLRVQASLDLTANLHELKPRVVDRTTHKDKFQFVYIPIDISSIPSVVNELTLYDQINRDYGLEPAVPSPVILGDLSMIDGKFISKENNTKELIMENYNFEFSKGLSALNKKFDNIAKSFLIKAEKSKNIIDKDEVSKKRKETTTKSENTGKGQDKVRRAYSRTTSKNKSTRKDTK